MATEQKKERTEAKRVRLTLVCVFITYILLTLLYYFLAGDQLKYRESRGNSVLPAAEAGSVELTSGVSVEQHFVSMVDRIENISVRFGTYYRANAGTLKMELIRPSNGEVLFSKDFPVADIAEGAVQVLEP